MKQDMYKIVFIYFSIHVSRIKRCSIPLEFVTSIYVGASHETVYTLPVNDFDALPMSVSNSIRTCPTVLLDPENVRI